MECRFGYNFHVINLFREGFGRPLIERIVDRRTLAVGRPVASYTRKITLPSRAGFSAETLTLGSETSLRAKSSVCCERQAGGFGFIKLIPIRPITTSWDSVSSVMSFRRMSGRSFHDSTMARQLRPNCTVGGG